MEKTLFSREFLRQISENASEKQRKKDAKCRRKMTQILEFAHNCAKDLNCKDIRSEPEHNLWEMTTEEKEARKNYDFAVARNANSSLTNPDLWTMPPSDNPTKLRKEQRKYLEHADRGKADPFTLRAKIELLSNADWMTDDNEAGRCEMDPHEK